MNHNECVLLFGVRKFHVLEFLEIQIKLKMSSVKRGKSGRFDDTMDTDSDDIDTKRRSRNLSEKKRRDQFNLLVNELCSMVSSGGRKMDKSTVLKSTISFLRNHNEVAARSRIHEIQEDWKPSFLTNEEFSHLILEAVHGFIMVFTETGEILYASESTTSLLGHLPNELLTSNIYEMVLEEEQSNIYSSLIGLADRESSPISFSCHVKCGSVGDQTNALELVLFAGYFRPIGEVGSKSGGSNETQDNRVFIGTGRLQTPQLIRDTSISDTKSEFTSRHSLEWKFLFLDHRAPPIIGYLPFELLGTSGYDYYHVDDLDNVVNCHEALMQKGEGTSCYYRFLTKGQQWIWLQTRFYITYHQWNSKPEFIVCSHRVVSYSEAVKQNRDVTSTSMLEGSSMSWAAKTSQCSTNSPCSVGTQNSMRSQKSESVSYVESPQYTPVLPVPPAVATNFQASLPPVGMSREQTILHADLQKKHAELQASIGQQQAELMMVSEQLLMAKLGLLSAQTQQPQVAPLTFSHNTPGAVSSTTLHPVIQGDLVPLVAGSPGELVQPSD